MEVKEMLDGIADEALRTQLSEAFKKVDKERGEFGRKLIEKDEEIKTFKTSSKQKSEWETMFKTLKDKNVDVKDIPNILEAMDVQKTTSDELKLVSALQKDTENKLKEALKEIKGNKVKASVDSVLTEVRANFKDDKGQVLTVLDEFIDKGKLYADVSDPDNKVLLEQRANEVLKGALQQQEALKAKFGFQGAQTFKVPEGNPNPGGVNNLAAELKTIAQKEGPVAALSEWFNKKGV